MATPPRPSAPDDNHGIAAQYGGLKVQMKGWPFILLIALALNIGVTIWATRLMRVDFERAHVQRATEHREIVNELGRSACLAAMTPEERSQFRAGARSWSRWCWWVRDEPSEGLYPRGDHDNNDRERRR